MGIGITGISKAALLPCTGGEENDPECAEEHITVDTPGRGKGKDAVKPGCYVPGRGGREYSLEFNYAAYDGWIRRLSLMALGVEPREAWNHSRRFRGKPFVELIAFPDTGGGAIGPITSAKLYGDFVAFAPGAKRYFATSTPNVFTPPQFDARTGKDTAQRKRMGLSAVVELTQSLFGSEFEWDEGKNLDWMWESYREFQRALRLVRNAGIVVFY